MGGRPAFGPICGGGPPPIIAGGGPVIDDGGACEAINGGPSTRDFLAESLNQKLIIAGVQQNRDALVRLPVRSIASPLSSAASGIAQRLAELHVKFVMVLYSEIQTIKQLLVRKVNSCYILIDVVAEFFQQFVLSAREFQFLRIRQMFALQRLIQRLHHIRKRKRVRVVSQIEQLQV